MKEKITKEYKRRQRLTLKLKLNVGNTVTAINKWAVAIFRYGSGIIKWKSSELKDLDRKSRKTLTMYVGSPPKSDVDSLYLKKRREQRIREEQNSLGFYVANSEEKGEN